MTYTRLHTRPSQKDLARVVYPLNNKSLELPDVGVLFRDGVGDHKPLHFRLAEELIRDLETKWTYAALLDMPGIRHLVAPFP